MGCCGSQNRTQTQSNTDKVPYRSNSKVSQDKLYSFQAIRQQQKKERLKIIQNMKNNDLNHQDTIYKHNQPPFGPKIQQNQNNNTHLIIDNNPKSFHQGQVETGALNSMDSGSQIGSTVNRLGGSQIESISNSNKKRDPTVKSGSAIEYRRRIQERSRQEEQEQQDKSN